MADVYFTITGVNEKTVQGQYPVTDCVGVIISGQSGLNTLPLTVNFYSTHDARTNGGDPGLLIGKNFTYQFPYKEQDPLPLNLYNFVLPLLKADTGWTDEQISITIVQ